MSSHSEIPSQPPRPRSLRTDYLGKKRNANHALAHQGDAVEPPPIEVPDGVLASKTDPVLIDTAAGLAELVERLGRSGSFAYDSEFMGEQNYFSKTCLVQTATAEDSWLVDPLSGLDMTAFWRLLADPKVEKIVHAGQPDMEPVGRTLGAVPANVFDTQVAAAFVGMPYPMALDRLIESLAGVKITKGPKFSRWDLRPLTPLQLRYAANDVRYLPHLKLVLARMLSDAGRLSWAISETREIMSIVLARDDHQKAIGRIQSARFLSDQKRGVLMSLIMWRDTTARREDIPPRSLVSDDVLATLVDELPAGEAELAKVKGLPKPVIHDYGTALLGLLHDPDVLPVVDASPDRPLRERTGDKERIDKISAALRTACIDRKIDPTIVFSRREVVPLYFAVRNGQAPRPSRLTRGWRAEVLGPLLAELLGAGI